MIKQNITIGDFLFFIVGAQFPDILEVILFNIAIKPDIRRLITHSFLFPIIHAVILLLFFPHDVAFYTFTLAFFGHLILDLFAGGDSVYFFSPILKYRIIIINKEKRLKIGNYVYQKLGYLWENGTNDDLAWFWVLQFFGSVFVVFAFCIYLISING